MQKFFTSSAFDRFNPALWATVALVLALPLVAIAQASKISLSGPSTARVAQQVTLNGSGFVPNSAVSVSVTTPDAVEAHYGAVARAEGSLSYTLLPATPGRYLIKVLDTSGKVLATVNLFATP